MSSVVPTNSQTIAERIAETATKLQAIGSEDARLEAELLLAHALGITRSQVLARLRERLDARAATTFIGLLERRLSHEPLAYITGSREFYGTDILCAPGALIPRPETELLVDIALRELRSAPRTLSVADVGTGTGAIAIAVAQNAQNAAVVAIDASAHALELARRNIDQHALARRIELRHRDLLDGAGEFDIILANLPYVAEDGWRLLPAEIRDQEPREALVGGERGPESIERLIDQAPASLRPGGLMALEIGDTQGEWMRAYAAERFHGGAVVIERDLAGLDRVLVIRRGDA